MSEIAEIELLLRDIRERIDLQQRELRLRLRKINEQRLQMILKDQKIRGLEAMYAQLLEDHNQRVLQRDRAIASAGDMEKRYQEAQTKADSLSCLLRKWLNGLDLGSAALDEAWRSGNPADLVSLERDTRKAIEGDVFVP